MSVESEGVESQGNGLVRHDLGLRFFTGGQLIVPSEPQFSAVLAEADCVEKLTGLRELRLAVAHLRTRRKLGAILMQTVRWGGARARLQRATLVDDSLPDGVDKFQARRCQQLATIPEGVFEDYLRASQANRKIPREAAAIRLLRTPSWTSSGRERAPRRGPANGFSLPLAILDGVERCMGEIDVLGGKAGMESVVA